MPASFGAKLSRLLRRPGRERHHQQPKGEHPVNMNAGIVRGTRLVAVLAFAALLFALPAWAGSNSTTLPNGASLDVSIDSPADGTQFLADGAPVPVSVAGTASIGLGSPQATIVYVLDASGSTGNGSGTCSEILSCEKTFFTGLNNAAAASGSVNHVGLMVFGADAVQADSQTVASTTTSASTRARTATRTARTTQRHSSRH